MSSFYSLTGRRAQRGLVRDPPGAGAALQRAGLHDRLRPLPRAGHSLHSLRHGSHCAIYKHNRIDFKNAAEKMLLFIFLHFVGISFHRHPALSHIS